MRRATLTKTPFGRSDAGHRRPDRQDRLEGTAMSCEHLICANCASPVVEARCPSCATARARVHHHGPGLTVPLTAAALVALALVLIVLQLTH